MQLNVESKLKINVGMCKELIEKGTQVTFKEVYDDMVQRDYNDMNREIAPLKQADDAVVCDTSNVDFEGSLELLLKTVRERLEN